MRTITNGCLDWDPELARRLSTTETARDLDILRSVIGDDKLTYAGSSYGTFIGASYAELFPDRVGRMVLDAGVDPKLTLAEMDIATAKGQQLALGAYVEDCVARGCALGGSQGGVMRRLEQFLQRLDERPISAGKRSVLTRDQALGIAVGLMQERGWPVLTKALAAGLAGDGRPLLRLSRYAYGYAEVGLENWYAGDATLCLDHAERPTIDEIRRSVPRFEKASPVFGSMLAWSGASCALWPVRSAAEPLDIDGSGAAPILVVSAVGDPVTPHEQSVALSDQLESGVLLMRKAFSHTSYGMGNRCVDSSVDTYLLTGEPPNDGKIC